MLGEFLPKRSHLKQRFAWTTHVAPPPQNLPAHIFCTESKPRCFIMFPSAINSLSTEAEKNGKTWRLGRLFVRLFFSGRNLIIDSLVRLSPQVWNTAIWKILQNYAALCSYMLCASAISLTRRRRQRCGSKRWLPWRPLLVFPFQFFGHLRPLVSLRSFLVLLSPNRLFGEQIRIFSERLVSM